MSRDQGYTLLELLIVLVLLGLVTSVVVPRLEQLYSSGKMAYERDDVLSQIAALGYRAYSQGQGFQLSHYPTSDPIPLVLPEGWQIQTQESIHYRANGVCEGGVLTLQYRQQSQRLTLAPPRCRPET